MTRPDPDVAHTLISRVLALVHDDAAGQPGEPWTADRALTYLRAHGLCTGPRDAAHLHDAIDAADLRRAIDDDVDHPAIPCDAGRDQRAALAWGASAAHHQAVSCLAWAPSLTDWWTTTEDDARKYAHSSGPDGPDESWKWTA